jgi:hypothetical protein
MKTYLYISIFILVSPFSNGQNPITLDTIYANDQKNVALFFPEPIRQGITGSDNFVFTFNRENEQYLGLLQAKPGKESNLLTVTKEGKVYSYILKYSEKLPKLNYFISENESIGSERPKIRKTEPEKRKAIAYKDRTDYFQRAGNYLLGLRHGALATKRNGGMRLRLQNMVHEGPEVYLVLEVKNSSGIDFEIDYLKVYRTNGNNDRKASNQRLPLEVIYKHKMPEAIPNGLSHSFVFVLSKFVLGDNEKLMLELKELNGSRKVVFEKGF